MKEQNLFKVPSVPDPQIIQNIIESNNIALKKVFKGRIKGNFLIDVKDQVMKVLGLNDLIKYYDFGWSEEKSVTGIGGSAEYDICRMIVGIHKAKSIFLSDSDIRRNEKNKRYKQQLINETIEKIKMRFYGSVHFRRMTLFRGEEFLYYPLPYELFVMSVKMNEMLSDGHDCNFHQLYYGVVYNSISALSLLEDNLFGTAYPLCRGAIEMYLRLLILAPRTELYKEYEKFRMFEIEYSCHQEYSEEFNAMFKKRICQTTKAKADFLHFGWVDYIHEYHKVVKKSPYSVYGIISFLKDENRDKNLGLDSLEDFYKSCHAYTHGSIQRARYPVLHYFEISFMLYLIIRETFLLLCREKGTESVIAEQDIISMIDKDFEVLYDQYQKRSTERFDKYYGLSS